MGCGKSWFWGNKCPWKNTDEEVKHILKNTFVFSHLSLPEPLKTKLPLRRCDDFWKWLQQMRFFSRLVLLAYLLQKHKISTYQNKPDDQKTICYTMPFNDFRYVTLNRGPKITKKQIHKYRKHRFLNPLNRCFTVAKPLVVNKLVFSQKTKRILLVRCLDEWGYPETLFFTICF